MSRNPQEQNEVSTLERKVQELLLLEQNRDKYSVDENLEEYFKVLNKGVTLEESIERLERGEVEGVNLFVISAVKRVLEDEELKGQLLDLYNKLVKSSEESQEFPLKYNLGNAFLYSILYLGQILEKLDEEGKKELIEWLKSKEEESEQFTRFQKFLLAGTSELFERFSVLGNPLFPNTVNATTSQDDHTAKIIGRHSRSKLPAPAVALESQINSSKPEEGSPIEKTKTALENFINSKFKEFVPNKIKLEQELLHRQIMKGLFEVFYGHRSLADLATVSLFFENIPMDLAMLLIGHALANGSEASTRYIEFIHDGKIIRRTFGIRKKEGVTLTEEEESALNVVESAIDLMSDYIREVGENWEDFLDKVKEVFRVYVMPFELFDKIRRSSDKKWNERTEENKKKIYDNTITKYAFDMLRGLLPMGTLTRLAVTQSSRTWYSTLKSLINYWLVSQDEQTLDLIKTIVAALRISVPSFMRDNSLEKEFKNVVRRARDIENMLQKSGVQRDGSEDKTTLIEREILDTFPAVENISQDEKGRSIDNLVELWPANLEKIIVLRNLLVGNASNPQIIQQKEEQWVRLELIEGANPVKYYQALLQRIYRLRGHSLEEAQEKALEKVIGIVGSDNYSKGLSREIEDKLRKLIMKELGIKEGIDSRILLKDEKLSMLLPFLKGEIFKFVISIGAWRDFNRHRSLERLPGGGYRILGGTQIIPDLFLTVHPIVKGGKLFAEDPETGEIKVVKEDYEGIPEIKKFIQKWQAKIFETYQKVLEVWPTIMRLSVEGKIENNFAPHYLLPFFTPIIAYMSGNIEKLSYFLTLRTTSEGNPEYVKLAHLAAIEHLRRNSVLRGFSVTNYGEDPIKLQRELEGQFGDDWQYVLGFLPYLPSLTRRLPRAGEVTRQKDAEQSLW